MSLTGLSALRSLPAGSILTIGNFDGVHLGHRALLTECRRLAQQRGGTRVVVATFDPHPSTVLRPETAPLRLTPLHLKTRLLKEAGADEIILLPPTPDLLNIEPDAFFAILRDEARISALVEGSDFCFGRNRRGTVPLLIEWTKAANITLSILPPVEASLHDRSIVTVSSSLIRFLAAAGRVRDARRCLGAPLYLSGSVVKGFQRGRTIGFPTANLDTTNNVVPMDGVYAARTTVNGTTYAAALNVGPIPTFSDKVRQIEAHLINFSGDLYGQTLDLELLDFLRDTQKFPGIEALKNQLTKDIERAKQIAA